MSEDDGGGYSEVTRQSWFSRIGKAFIGIFIGILLFPVAIGLLWWNEGRAVQTARSLAEGKGVVVSISPETVDPADDGNLVHVIGKADSEGTPTDPTFNIAAPHKLRLIRHVEMYQWKEHKKTESHRNVGGKNITKTSYSYEKVWSAHEIKSGEFKQAGTHTNPGSMPYPTQDWMADKVTLGAFTLPAHLIQQISNRQKLAMTQEKYDKLPDKLKKEFKLTSDGYLYRQKTRSAENSGETVIGDVRVWYEVVPPATVSILTEQSKDSFRPYRTKAGDSINRLEMGDQSAAEMFEHAEAENTLLTWILRLVGWIVMAIGIYLVFQPLVVIADVIPFLGDLASAAIAAFAALISLGLSLVIIAVAWLFFRPVLAIGLLAGAAVIAVSLIFLLRRQRKGMKDEG